MVAEFILSFTIGVKFLSWIRNFRVQYRLERKKKKKLFSARKFVYVFSINSADHNVLGWLKRDELLFMHILLSTPG